MSLKLALNLIAIEYISTLKKDAHYDTGGHACQCTDQMDPHTRR